ncbi:MAG: hypothetical protein KDH17_09480 [Rhodocyclaceae bacterium]|nr:hypothetical protein [Rhodocyclaceae bacterium]
MARHHPLYLTSDCLRWYRRDAGRVELLERFDADERGVAAFSARLAAKSHHDQYSLLIDVADEGFNQELVPSIRGRDRAAMLERKLAQQFYGSNYTAALSLGREKHGRRDERLLLAALTRPAQIDPWINAMIAARIRVRGVHSVPLLLDRVMARSRIPMTSYLLVNLSPAGIRQTYFNQGRVRFSRLAGSNNRRFDASLDAAGEEIRKTLAYLSTQRLTARGERPPVVALVGAEQFDRLKQHLERDGELTVRLAELERLRTSYGGAGGAQAPGDSVPLLLDALGSELQCAQIGGESVLRFQKLHQLRKGLYLGAAGVLAVSTGVYLLGFVETIGLRSEARELQRLVGSEDRRHAELMQRLPPMPAPIAEMRQLIDAAEQIETGRVSPLSVYRAVASALDQLPDIRLERLEWRIVDRNDEVQEGKVTVIAELGLPMRMAGDQRGMVETSERFVVELGRSTGGKVRLTRRPVDLQSTQTLRVRDDSNQGSPARAPSFEVEFMLSGKTSG